MELGVLLLATATASTLQTAGAREPHGMNCHSIAPVGMAERAAGEARGR